MYVSSGINQTKRELELLVSCLHNRSANLCQQTKRTGVCYLCLNKKLFIIENQGNDLLNQRNELISKCRHKNKFKLLATLWKVSLFGAFFWCEFFPAFGLNMETYKVSPRIHSECGIISTRLIPNANTFHTIDVRTLLHYFNGNLQL